MPHPPRRTELPVGVRVIRQVAPPESPWPGSLVRTADGASGLLVDAGILDDWEGWDAAPGGHILGPLDVLRRADGHDLLLPVCTEPVDALLTRRGAALPLNDGEAVTLAVSVLRGVAEIAQRETPDGARGRWWLTDDGRPVFVDDHDAGSGADAAAVDLIERLAAAAGPHLAGALRDAAAAMRDPQRLIRELDDVEGRLFDVAAAEPIATAPLATTRRRQVAAGAETSDGVEAEEPRHWWGAMAASVDSDLADAFSQATTGLWRRLRRPKRLGRRRVWVLAGSLGASVIAIGLLWPTPPGTAVADPNVSASPVSAASPQPDGTAARVPTSEPSPGTEDLAAVTNALLDQRTACLASGDDRCLAGVVEDPARQIPTGAVDAAASERTVTLLDEFGGMAVLRAESTATTAAQLVVIVQADGHWLLRDVHEVAPQP